MVPTLLVGDHVIVNKVEYKFSKISRGDIVALYSPVENKELVKRVVGLPGEEVLLSKEGLIYINDQPLDEIYLPDNLEAYYNDELYILENDQYFLMGDNRNNSSDSRVFGPVNKKQIFGRVFFIYGPFSRIGRVH